MAKYTITFTVEGVPGGSISREYYFWQNTTRKEFRGMIMREYGGKKVEILDIRPKGPSIE